MPASTLDPVSAALRTSLTKSESENSLDSQLAGSTKKALLSDIDFDSAGSYQTTVLDKLKSKYIVLKSTDTPKASKPEEDMGADETLKLAKHELYPLEAVQLGWNNCDWSVGAGMVNMGNTCYLNSTLQALFHVPALVNWLMSDKEHSSICQNSGTVCIICAMRKTLQESQQRNATTIRPMLIYNKLRMVCRNLIPGRQEDAHEFLRYLVEAMEKSYLSRFKNNSEFDSKTKETTPLNQILGGYLRSAVRCLKCGHVSTTFQHFQDLLLDIRKAQTVDEALESYFSREKLDDESYQCEACQKKVPATKQFSLERAPMVLCIQLKRFSVSNNKISKHVTFRNRLDLTKFARHRPNVPLIYRFVALVTHMGPNVSCGHYTAVAQAPSGNFYQFDDSMVRPISHQAVFNTNAYIMLYELESSPYSQKTTLTASAAPVKTKPVADFSQASSSSTNTAGLTSKASTNGVGYTSNKVYGPELPPNRLIVKTNGLVSSSMVNGNGKKHNSSSGSDSDSEDGGSVIKRSNGGSPQKENARVSSTPVTPRKEADSSSGAPSASNKTPLASISNNRSVGTVASTPNSRITTSAASPISADSPSKKTINKDGSSSSSTSSPGQMTKSLVPYDADDTSNSEDSNLSKEDIEIRVTSSTDLAPATSDGKRWERESSTNNSNSTAGSSNSSSNTVSELFKMSHSGYSAPVATWNGTRSALDKEVSNERREERKRTLTPDSSDQGRVKHPKVSSSFKSNPGYNPIQEFHNAKNWSQNNGSSNHYKSFYNGRHRRNFHHKNNYHKSYRFRQ
ncbi:ubiquitin carboxyl-terminal hydrolase 36 isoform X2 [Aethina tumida]|uniref:ubiquitin carboxyl-terminal hydrolase 36 isoform X2 n=1 Tax=Aethina tumida TaxID=116153 RepID=UPI0021488F39|nr:ubiquitin carboxyl-terminal hydrolase 36 isoform X2 [Aethina tumida]